MKAFINHHLYLQTGVDSAALTMLGAVMHNFPEPGDYRGTVFLGKAAVGVFNLKVDKDCPATQVDIDLAGLTAAPGERCAGTARPPFVVNPKGYAVFHVSRGAGGYAAVVGKLGGETNVVSFDTRELKEGDLFAVTLIRPGTYSVRHSPSGAKGEITVAYPPKVGPQAYRPPEPVTIQCTDQEIKPDKIRLSAAQGQVYRFGKKGSRIRIDLVKADDGPGGPPAEKPKVISWKKPKAK